MKKLQGKDLINIGIFNAIYFVIVFAVGMLGYIPIFIPLLSVLVLLIGGIPMMLYFSKINKFGMLTITGLPCGVLMLVTGMGYWSVLTGLIFGIIGDFMLKGFNYKNGKMEIVTYGVFSVWIVGNFIPVFIARDSYYQQLLEGWGKEYADTLMRYMPTWIVPVLIIAALVSGLIGGMFGRKIFKKHFERAGIV